MRAVRGRLVRFHLDLDLGSFFEFHFVAILVGKIVGNANFAVEVIRALDANLRFFRFSGTGMWTNHLLYFAWKCSASLCLLRHELIPPIACARLRFYGQDEVWNGRRLRPVSYVFPCT